MKKAQNIVVVFMYAIVVLLGMSQCQKMKGVASGPLNDARMENEQVLLECESTGGESRIAWYEYASGNPYGRQISDEEYILEGHPSHDRYTIVHNDSTSYDLLIDGTLLTDGGAYRCVDMEDPVEETAYAELIIMRSDPVCVSTAAPSGEVIVGHTYDMQCSVDYKGNVAPLMTWTGPEPYVLEESTTDETVSSKLSFTVSTSMDGSQYSCKTNYTEDDFTDLPVDYATNTPAYTHLYEGPVLDVYCSVSCTEPSESTSQTPSTTTTGSTTTGAGYTETLIQESSGTNSFNKSWEECKVGFYNTSSLWLGNEVIHQLTRDGNCRARFDLLAQMNNVWYAAEYDLFIVGDESTDYQLSIGGYSGNISNAMSIHDGMKFTTYDRDNDNWLAPGDDNCASFYSGAWWFGACCSSCITLPGLNFHWSDTLLEASRIWLLCNN